MLAHTDCDHDRAVPPPQRDARPFLRRHCPRYRPLSSSVGPQSLVCLNSLSHVSLLCVSCVRGWRKCSCEGCAAVSGLNLNETMMPEHMNNAGYISHIVGKVCDPLSKSSTLMFLADPPTAIFQIRCSGTWGSRRGRTPPLSAGSPPSTAFTAAPKTITGTGRRDLSTSTRTRVQSAAQTARSPSTTRCLTAVPRRTTTAPATPIRGTRTARPVTIGSTVSHPPSVPAPSPPPFATALTLQTNHKRCDAVGIGWDIFLLR